MSRYLLDTNACIALMMKANPGVVARIREVGMESLVLCAPVKAELWFGACKSQRVAENRDRLRQFFNDLPSLPFDDTAAERYGEVRATLAVQGKPIGPYDLQIATSCRAAESRAGYGR
jgi:tRNA(fMet)-specific endonuclease VapC